jgi:hypothetical protein
MMCLQGDGLRVLATTPYDEHLMSVPVRLSQLVAAIAIVVVLSGCSVLEMGVAGMTQRVEEEPVAGQPGGDQFPDVLAVELRPTSDRVFDVDVTLSSPYDTPQRYADGWRVLDADGVVLGTHTLMHDHAAEQPFTRTQRDLLISVGTDEITVQGRDQANGFGGLSLTVSVPQ